MSGLIHRRVIPCNEFAGTNLYTWVNRGTVGVNCLALEHNKVSLTRAKTLITQTGVECTNHKTLVCIVCALIG